MLANDSPIGLRHAFSGNSKQLQRQDSVHLSSVYTNYSLSSLHALNHSISISRRKSSKSVSASAESMNSECLNNWRTSITNRYVNSRSPNSSMRDLIWCWHGINQLLNQYALFVYDRAAVRKSHNDCVHILAEHVGVPNALAQGSHNSSG